MITDTTEFFNLDDFAELVKVNGRTIKAIFDRQMVDHQEGMAVVTGYQPHLTCQTVDFQKTGAVQGSDVIVRKQPYKVVDIRPDGTGISTIMLFENPQ